MKKTRKMRRMRKMKIISMMLSILTIVSALSFAASATDGGCDALGHDYGIDLRPATTCTEDGYIILSCEKCGDSWDSRYDDEAKEYLIDNGFDLKRLAHKDTDSDHVCNRGCGEVISEHTGGTPTCTEKAVCAICGEEYISASEHTEEILPAVPATCTESGLTEGVKCAECGEIIVEQTVVEAFGHSDADSDNECDVCGEAVYGGVIGSVIDSVNSVKQGIETVKESVISAVDTVKNSVENLVDKANKTANEVADKVVNGAREAADRAREAAHDAVKSINETVDSIQANIIDFIDGFSAKLEELFERY